MAAVYDWKIARDNMFRLRTKAKLNQKELGKELGVSDACICNYENGYVIPKMSYMEKFCHYFGIGIDDLYEKDLIKNVLNI